MAKYNEELNCVYIDIPRTGCGSISSIIGGGGHKTATVMQERLGKKWDEAYTFAFVRNPFDRFVSAFHNLGLEKECDINDFIKDSKGIMEKEQILFMPQVDWIVKGGKVQVDFVGRYEDLQRDWKKVRKVLGIKDVLPHLNRTTVKKHVLNSESKGLLSELYKEDFKTFGYADH